MSRSKPTPDIDIKRKRWSIAFFLAIPVVYAFAVVSGLVFFSVAQVKGFSAPQWGAFLLTAVGVSSLIASSKMPWLRTFIHETKHAVVVGLSGNKLTDLHVDRHTGHVHYIMYLQSVHFEPFIILAPYCFPLFSLPMFVLCVVLENMYFLPLVFMLSAALAIDLTLQAQEIHPHQTDLQCIAGGPTVAYLFIAGVNLFWTLCCLLWIQSGNNSFLLLWSAFTSVLKSLL